MHFCVSSISAWWFVWRFCYIRNVLLFPTRLNVYQSFNFRKIKNLFMVSARFCEINLFCKYSSLSYGKSKRFCIFHIIKTLHILTKYHSQPTFLIRISAVFCELVLAALCRGVYPMSSFVSDSLGTFSRIFVTGLEKKHMVVLKQIL